MAKPISPVINDPTFSAYEIKIAENQPEYQTLPALQLRDATDTIITRWKLSFGERLRVLFYGDVYLHILRFHKNLQPVLIEVTPPKLVTENDE